MTEPIKSEGISPIWKKLNDSQKHLRQKNVYQALLSFKETLEKRMSTAMLHTDARELDEEINTFQQELFGSKAFRDKFGPVSFQDNEQSTLLEFILQLIKVQDQNLLETVSDQLNSPDESESKSGSEIELEQKAKLVMDFIDKGNLKSAKQHLAKDYELGVFVANLYNSIGISSREKRDFDDAIKQYKKALIVLPDDEGLYYNLARSWIEKDELNEALESVKEALKLNPEFKEANQLYKYIMGKKAEVS